MTGVQTCALPISWLNAVERVFSDVREKCLRRRSADSVEALQQAIGQHLERRNEKPKSLHWKATAVEILRFLDALDAAPG